jgi:hypothetical protein
MSCLLSSPFPLSESAAHCCFLSTLFWPFRGLDIGTNLNKQPMHYFLKPLIRALRHMNDSELRLTIILGFLLFLAGLLDLYRSAI